MKIRSPLPLLIAGLFAAIGCTETPADLANGDDPLKALTAESASTRYDGSYWIRQRSERPKLYEDALAYCAEQSADVKPNCGQVAIAARFFESKGRIGGREGRRYTGMLGKDTSSSPPSEQSSGLEDIPDPERP